MPRPITAAVLVVLALSTAACSSSKPTTGPEREAYVEALARDFRAGDNATDEQADCIARRWVRELTVDRFERSGLTPTGVNTHEHHGFSRLGLDQDEAVRLIEAMDRCGLDPVELTIRQIAKRQTLSVSREQCLRDALDRQDVSEGLAAELRDERPPADIVDAVQGQVRACR